jgi:exonuclease VII small subunit
VRKLLLMVVIFLPVSLVITGCGVAQDKYDAVVADLANAQQETQSIKAELETAKAGLSELTANLDKTTADLESAIDELKEANSKYSELSSSYDAAQAELSQAKDSIVSLNSEISGLKQRIPNLVYETYTNDDVGFSIDYPENWSTSIDLFGNGEGIVTFMDKDTGTNIIVSCEKLTESLSAQEYHDLIVEQLLDMGQYYFWGSYEITVSSMKAVQGIITNTEAADETVVQIIVSLVNDQTAWTIIHSCGLSNFLDNVHTFNEVTNSFKLSGSGSKT